MNQHNNTKPPTPTPENKIVFRISPHLHNQFEIRCIEQSQTMSKVLRDAVNQYICTTNGKDRPNLK